VTTDAVYLPVLLGGTGDLKLTEAYGIRGAFNHNWDPYWSSSLFGAVTGVRYNGAVGDLSTAKGQYCRIFVIGKTVSPDFTCNPDFNTYQVGLVTRWTPVKKPDVLGRSPVLQARSEVHRCDHDRRRTGCPEAGWRRLRAEGPGHGYSQRSRSAQLLIPSV
jgi:hypothetical protein